MKQQVLLIQIHKSTDLLRVVKVDLVRLAVMVRLMVLVEVVEVDILVLLPLSYHNKVVKMMIMQELLSGSKLDK